MIELATPADLEKVVKQPVIPVTVDGQPVRAMYALFHKPIFLITPDKGTHEITRCYVDERGVRLGPDTDRIAGLKPSSVKADATGGVTIELDDGYVMHAPPGITQLTYRKFPA